MFVGKSVFHRCSRINKLTASKETLNFLDDTGSQGCGGGGAQQADAVSSVQFSYSEVGYGGQSEAVGQSG